MLGTLAVGGVAALATAAGAAPPTVAAERRPATTVAQVSVRDHGARGDGSTDDTAAINRALAAARLARQKVWFPAGTYVVRPGTSGFCLPLTYGAILAGEAGATVKMADWAGNYAGLVGPVTPGTDLSGLTIEGLTFDMNGRRNPVIDPAAQLAPPHQRRGVVAWAGTGIRVQRCVFKDLQGTWYVEILGPQVSQVTVVNCEFRDAGTTFVDYDHTSLYLDCTHGTVQNNLFTTTKPFGARQGFELHGGPHVASGNRIHGYVFAIDCVGSQWHGPCAASVTSNVITGATCGFQLWSYTPSGPGISGVTIEGNIVELDHTKKAGTWACNGVGLHVGSTSAVEDLTIRGNVFTLANHGSATALDGYSSGVCLARDPAGITDRDIVIEGNTFDGVCAGGIAYRNNQGAVDGLHIRDNTFRNVGVLGTSSYPAALNSGVYLASTSARAIEVSENRLIDEQSTHTIHAWSYVATPVLAAVTVRDNQVVCSDNAAIKHASASAVTAGAIELTAIVNGWTAPTGRFTQGSSVTDEVSGITYEQHTEGGAAWSPGSTQTAE